MILVSLVAVAAAEENYDPYSYFVIVVLRIVICDILVLDGMRHVIVVDVIRPPPYDVIELSVAVFVSIKRQFLRLSYLIYLSDS